jgi:hypothetical protein
MAYANRAPRWITMIIALVLVLLGALGTFSGAYEDLGVWLLVAATVVMLLGVFVPGL